MPQFDILTTGSQIFGLFLFLYFLYYFNIKNTIPYFVEIKKFRTKKLVQNHESVGCIKDYLNSDLKYTYSFYHTFLK